MVPTLPFFGGSGACAEPASPSAPRPGARRSLEPRRLSLARGGQDDAVERLLSSIKPIAEAMGITIAPFPPRAATNIDTYGEVIVYLVEGAGAGPGARLPPSSARTQACLRRRDQIQSAAPAL